MKQFLLRSVLPLAMCAVVLAIHFVWLGFFPEQDPAQSQWAAVPGPSNSTWLARYIETGGYWFGYSYALSIGLAWWWMRRAERKAVDATQLKGVCECDSAPSGMARIITVP